ncbi:RIP metalloprotease RseP [Desulfuribacillus alkaliarsenatis]|uniref:Zinc metalloprotease n=1 Tax=Desulfuribacillus alkaliarsenatis TaxID=766136 RepID=A0A1E5G6A1_9FIRM|nr:RIP metalloprotease RseP [Desulfuribacillus alkaliarsenatis]OEF98639.1 RIP metalloprotease RseP [Desulfuribacillus alkaliarsenatis]
MQTAIAAIIVFGVLVFIHELGHYLVAKRVGILVREFAIGFGPKVISFKRGETLYTIRALPLGGFVRMAGEDPESYEMKNGIRVGLQLDNEHKVTKIDLKPHSKYDVIGKIESFDIEKDMYIRIEQEQRSVTYKVDDSAMIVKGNDEMQIAPHDRKFNGKTVGQRAATIFAGPLMNFVLAGLLFAIVIAMMGVPSNASIIGDVVPDNPAAEAGILPGDQIVAVDGKPVTTWSQLVTEVRERPNQTINVEVVRGTESITLSLTTAEQAGAGWIGIQQMTEEAGFMSLVYGFRQMYDLTILLFTHLGEMFTGQVEADVAGPVGIIQIIGIQANEGIIQLIYLAAFLSLNLGIINLFPIPALDGGRLVFLGIEALRGKPLDPNKEGFIHFIGFALLMLLIIVVTYRDVVRIFS